jgi:hypothetical protein
MASSPGSRRLANTVAATAVTKADWKSLRRSVEAEARKLGPASIPSPSI